MATRRKISKGKKKVSTPSRKKASASKSTKVKRSRSPKAKKAGHSVKRASTKRHVSTNRSTAKRTSKSTAKKAVKKAVRKAVRKVGTKTKKTGSIEKKRRGSTTGHHAKKKTTRSTRKYSPSSQDSVKKEMHEFKRGKAHSGRSGKLVKSRKQAIAIGLSKARNKGAKVPAKKR